MSSALGEKQYYPIVRKWLEKKGYYCGGSIVDSKGNPIYYQDKGTRRLRVDVAGIKNVGSRVSNEIEVVAVEVRDKRNVSIRDIQAAYTYAQYAHKCYLATTGLIDNQDKTDAQRLGIGLLQVKNHRVIEVLNPQSKIPDYSMMLKFLNVLEVAKCSICGCFFETYIIEDDDYKSFYRLIRPKYFKSAQDYPGVDVLDAKEIKKLKTGYRTYIFICRTCMEEFFPTKQLGDFHAIYDKEEEGFLCRMGSRKHNDEIVYDAGEIVEHLRDKHGINPKNKVIKGWNNQLEKKAKKYLRLHK